MNIVGKRVKKARSLFKPKLTQTELAAKLQLLGWEINRSGVAKIEMGIRHICDFELLMLAEALRVKVQWLLGDDK